MSIASRPQEQRQEGTGGAAAQPSSAYLAYRRSVRMHRIGVLAVQMLLLVIGLALWQYAADHYWVNPMLTSKPSKVWETLMKLSVNGSLVRHTLVTLQETMLGFAVGMALGVAVSVALWWWPAFSRVMDPYLVVLNAMPKIALGPILYVWLGEVHSIYGMAVAISVVVTIVMVYVGFRAVDPQKIKLMQTFGASKLQMLQKVVFPASLPTLVATLKVNIGLTLTGVIVGEFISSKAGLGYLIIYGGQVFQMELVMTSIVILLVISAVMYLAIGWLEKLVARIWHLQVRS